MRSVTIAKRQGRPVTLQSESDISTSAYFYIGCTKSMYVFAPGADDDIITYDFPIVLLAKTYDNRGVTVSVRANSKYQVPAKYFFDNGILIWSTETQLFLQSVAEQYPICIIAADIEAQRNMTEFIMRLEMIDESCSYSASYTAKLALMRDSALLKVAVSETHNFTSYMWLDLDYFRKLCDAASDIAFVDTVNDNIKAAVPRFSEKSFDEFFVCRTSISCLSVGFYKPSEETGKLLKRMSEVPGCFVHTHFDYTYMFGMAPSIERAAVRLPWRVNETKYAKSASVIAQILLGRTVSVSSGDIKWMYMNKYGLEEGDWPAEEARLRSILGVETEKEVLANLHTLIV